ncbi:MAG: glycerol-3-phosphate transporter, partial [Desulfobacteraceae bacterium]
MVEHRPWLTFLTHATLLMGMVIVIFPIYVTFVASTHTLEEIATRFPLLPGSHLVENYIKALSLGPRDVGSTVGQM